MCVIYVCKKTLPEIDELNRGAEFNDDGAGIAWLAPTPEAAKDEAKKNDPAHLQVWWDKTLKTAKDVEQFIKDKKIPLPYIIHFRTASVGDACSELSHPFPVVEGVPLWTAGRASEVLFHNGHIGDWDSQLLKFAQGTDEPVPMGDWSDSRALAWFTHLKGNGILPFLAKGSRVAVMYSDPDTVGSKKYSRIHDHITMYGSGWISKEGYAQSISTEWRNRGGVRQGDACSMPGAKSTTPTAGGDGKSVAVLPPSKSADVKFGVDEFPPNTYTLAELHQILRQVEGEQRDARVAAGA